MKMKNTMFFPKGDEINEGIISTDPPIGYLENKKITLTRGIEKEEYNEVYEFLRDQNKMSSGNFTLFPKDEISRYVRLNAFAVLMRSQNNSSLIGTIFSVPFPIRCISKNENKIIPHGCTTFLNIHDKLRKHGLCMALIRELTKYGFEKDVLCSYSLTSFPLSTKSFPISSWYRPINLPRSIGLGFNYPNWNAPSEFLKNRLMYNTKMPKKYVCERVESKNIEKALTFYQLITQDKKFVYMPDLNCFRKWIQEYPTFLISFEKKPVGIFSISSVYCRMESSLDGKLALPLIFNSDPKHAISVMKSLIFVVSERDYDVLYTHCVGDMNKELLKTINAIETRDKSYLSLYNNSMTLTSSDLYVPLF